MKNKKLYSITAILLCSTLTACSGGEYIDNSTTNTVLPAEFSSTLSSNTESVTSQNSQVTNIENFRLYNAANYTFSDDICVIGFHNDESENYNVAVDKNGKILFSIKVSKSIPVTNFENGYAYGIEYAGLETTGSINEFVMAADVLGVNMTSLRIINKSGEVQTTLEFDERHSAKAYGFGYTVVENVSSDFDGHVYSYTIFDPKGKEVQQLSFDENQQVNVKYCNEGVFSFNNYGSRQETTLYLASEDKVVKISDYNDTPEFYNGKYVLDCRDNHLVILNKNGNIEQVDMNSPLGFDTSNPKYRGDVCFFYSDSLYHENVSCYNFQDGECYQLESKYLDAVLKTLSVNGITLSGKMNYNFNSGVLALKLKGKDGKTYCGIFDSKLNLVKDLIEIKGTVDSGNDLAFKFQFNDGRLITYTTNSEPQVIDEKGNVVFKLSEGSFLTDYSDEVALVNGEYFIDTNGNKLFSLDDIDLNYAAGIAKDI